MKIRKYEEKDCEQIVKLFYQTVHSVNAKDYSKEQLNVWATGTEDVAHWNESLLEHYSIVAESDGIIIGFGDIDGNYIDRLFVHKDYQNTGIATAITDILEKYALNNAEIKIITHASITAKPFFERRGYKVITRQQIERNRVWLTNFVMEKTLSN